LKLINQTIDLLSKVMEVVEDDNDKVVLEQMMQEYRLDMKVIDYLYHHTLKNENLSPMQYAINSLSMNGIKIIDLIMKSALVIADLTANLKRLEGEIAYIKKQQQ
jgi:hypothetical protein